jgi:hypothetical protein
MATFTVTTNADIVNASDGVLSLREAVTQANATTAADTILFASTMEGNTLVLTGGELTLSQDTSIDGDQNNDGLRVSISGGDTSRIMAITGAQTDIALRDIVLRDGHSLVTGTSTAQAGGAIYAGGKSLTIASSDLIGNTTFTAFGYGYYAMGDGGAIFSAGGTLSITNSNFEGNSGDTGGAIATAYGTVTNLDVVDSYFYRNFAYNAGAIALNGNMQIMNSTISYNRSHIRYSYNDYGGDSGGILLVGNGSITSSSIINNDTHDSGGGIALYGNLTIADSTVAHNSAHSSYGGFGGGIKVGQGNLIVRNSTITSNSVGGYDDRGGGAGIALSSTATLDIANSIVAGNTARGDAVIDPDISGVITFSNGHNIFGTDVPGNIAGDLENIAASTIFTAIDPATGGGQVNAAGIVPLRASVTNPALGGADRLSIGSTDQIGTSRPSPTGTNPDIGSAESGFAHSTVSSANNDTLTGTAAANTLSGKGGHDFLKGLGGADTLNGGDGGDFLEGGAGNDKLNGNAGIDIANYGDLNTAVTVDLRGDTAADKDTAKRGTETDTLTGIEGAIAAGGNDTFFGDNSANWFQGGGGKDTFTGGAGRDTYDYNQVSASPSGTGRDVITDFDHLVDKIDLMGIDGDTAIAGNQALRWVGTEALTGPGEVGYFTSGGNTIVRISNDADVATESEIQLTGIKALSALDFYL